MKEIQNRALKSTPRTNMTMSAVVRKHEGNSENDWCLASTHKLPKSLSLASCFSEKSRSATGSQAWPEIKFSLPNITPLYPLGAAQVYLKNHNNKNETRANQSPPEREPERSAASASDENEDATFLFFSFYLLLLSTFPLCFLTDFFRDFFWQTFP